jgi:hypothetical protein
MASLSAILSDQTAKRPKAFVVTFFFGLFYSQSLPFVCECMCLYFWTRQAWKEKLPMVGRGVEFFLDNPIPTTMLSLCILLLHMCTYVRSIYLYILCV